MKRRLLILAVTFLMCMQFVCAQEGIPLQSSSSLGIRQYVNVGFNLGGTTPLSLPNTIRAIDSWQPLLIPTLGYEIVYPINSNWGIGAGLRLEYKGMTVKDSVKYFHTIITVNQGGQSGEFEGDFSGKNKTVVKNGYLTLPVNVEYHSNENWRFKLGFYVAWLFKASFSGNVSDGYIRNGDSLGEKVLIDQADFSFGYEERRFDWGLQGGADRSLGKRFSVYANLNWGLQSIFPSSFQGVGFKMYNIYGNLGLSYRL